MKKIVLALVLCLAMVLSVLPMGVFAAENESITYIDRSWNGEKIVETEKECTDYVVVDDTISAFEDGGWYVATGDVTNENRIKTNGTVNLILCDGCTLNATSGIIVNEGDALNVYCQSDDSGILIAKASKFDAGIGSDQRINSGIISIYGGSVDATGGYCSAAIGGGMNGSGAVNIYGGTVNADNSMGETNAFAAAIGGSTLADDTVVTIYGGTVTATGKHGAGIGGAYYQKGTVTINGGNITATSEVGAGIGCGRLGNGGKITINGGVVVASSDYGAGIGGGSGSEIEINSGIVTATSVNSAGIGGDYDVTDHGTLTVAENAVIKAGDSEPGTEVTADEYIQNRNKYVNITFPEPLEPVKYIDRSWDGEKVVETEKKCAGYIVVDANTTTFEDGKWYVVNGEVTISGRIVVSGTANLILCDGCTLNANSGIQLFEGNALNIYGQSADSGKLNAKASYVGNSGIGGNQNDGNGGDLTVYGGSIYASGKSNAAGIGGGWRKSGGSFTMYGGSVEAKAYNQNAAGIGKGFGGSDGNFTVYGTPQVYAGDTAPDIGTTVAGYQSSRNSYVKIIYSNHVHTWLDATCTEPQTCSECGEKTGSPLDHTWVKGDMISEATCTQPAVYRYECSRCRETKNDVFGEKAAHHFVNTACTECGINEFVIDESGCLTGYNGYGGDVVIPEGVTSIGDYAFVDCSSLTEVMIPEGVTSIGKSAFNGCLRLTEVTIPEGVTSIGKSAFNGCLRLTEVTIPEGVTSIGDYAFERCSSLTEVTIPEGVTSIGNFAFNGCLRLKEVTIPESVTSIGDYAFYNCSELQTVTITHNIESASENAFDLTKITTINYPCGDDLVKIKLYFGDLVIMHDRTYNAVHVYSAQGTLVSAATCEHPAVYTAKCKGCGLVGTMDVGEALGHTLTAATCTEAPFCLVCHEKVGEPLGHSFENGVCTKCGYTLPVTFDSVSLVLSGELGLNFYTVVNDAEAVKDGYMLFEIGNKGETQKVYFTDAVLVGERYVFTCNVNALQMADTITVSFHYGDTVVGPKTTSVADYIGKVIANHNNDDTDPTVKLAKSILNYGHYAQLALSELHGFTLGTDYAVTYNLSDVTIANAADLEAYKATKTGSIDGITKVSRSLSLDHGTDINLYMTVAEAYEPTVNVTDKNGNTVDFTLEKQADGRYLLVIPQISAHELGDMYTVSVDGGAMTINVSALSYAYSVLSSEKTDEQKLCVSALYEYYNAAISYKESVYGGHSFGEWIDEIPSTCINNGVKAHKNCLICGKNFDADGNEITDLKLPLGEHDYQKCCTSSDSAFHTAAQVCSVCGNIGGESEKEIHTFANKDAEHIVCFDCGFEMLKPSEGINYEVEGNHAAVISTTDENTDDAIVVASIYDGKPVTKIEVGAFSCCTMSQIFLPDTIKEICNYSFAYCDNLTSVVLPEKLEVLGYGVFGESPSITDVTFPDSITSVGRMYFDGENHINIQFTEYDHCYYLGNENNPYLVLCYSDVNANNITIPDGTKVIADYAFAHYGENKMQTIVVPDTIVTVGDYAFATCDALDKVYYKGTKSQWNDIVINNDMMNQDFTDSIRYYYSEKQPLEAGHFWVYVDGTAMEW